MRTTLDIPDAVLKSVKTQALREGVTLKAWFVSRLRRELDRGESVAPADQATRFRARFRETFEPGDIDTHKRAGRA